APPELGLVALRGQGNDFCTTDLSPDGRFALTGYRNGRVDIWDAARGSLLGKPLQHPNQQLGSALWCSDGRTVVTVTETPGKGAELHFWDRVAGQETRSTMAHEAMVRVIAVSSDAQLLLTGTQGGTIRLFEAGGARLRYTLEKQGRIDYLHFSPDDRLFVSCS